MSWHCCCVRPLRASSLPSVYLMTQQPFALGETAAVFLAGLAFALFFVLTSFVLAVLDSAALAFDALDLVTLVAATRLAGAARELVFDLDGRLTGFLTDPPRGPSIASRRSSRDSRDGTG